jgi:hypothetical protein
MTALPFSARQGLTCVLETRLESSTSAGIIHGIVIGRGNSPSFSPVFHSDVCGTVIHMSEREGAILSGRIRPGCLAVHSKWLRIATSGRPIGKSLDLTLQWTDGPSQFKNGNSRLLARFFQAHEAFAQFGLYSGTKLETYL